MHTKDELCRAAERPRRQGSESPRGARRGGRNAAGSPQESPFSLSPCKLHARSQRGGSGFPAARPGGGCRPADTLPLKEPPLPRHVLQALPKTLHTAFRLGEAPEAREGPGAERGPSLQTPEAEPRIGAGGDGRRHRAGSGRGGRQRTRQRGELRSLLGARGGEGRGAGGGRVGEAGARRAGGEPSWRRAGPGPEPLRATRAPSSRA